MLLSINKIFISNKIKSLMGNGLVINTLKVSLISVLVKVITFFKDIFITKYFIFDKVLDSFFIGLIVPQFILGVFIYSINSIVVPNYLRESKENPNNLGSFTYTCLIISLIFGLIISFISLFFFDNILHLFTVNNSSKEIILLAKTHFYFLIPTVLFSSISSYIGAIYNSKNKYLLTSSTPVIAIITTIISLFYVENLGIYALSIGFTIGYFIEMIVMIFSLNSSKIAFKFKFNITPSVKELLIQSVFKINASLFAAFIMIVNQIYATKVGEGSLSMINYAQKIPLFINVIVTMSIGITILPYFSKQLYDNENGYKLKSYIKITLQLFIFSAFLVSILMLFSFPIIDLLFHRGEIKINQIKIISNLQIIYFLQVPFYLISIISVRLLTSMNKNKITLYASIVSLVVIYISNEVMYKYYGIYGIAWSMFISVIFNMTLNFFLSYSELKKINR
jgi:putative peptidoglycan lipid II flippase